MSHIIAPGPSFLPVMMHAILNTKQDVWPPEVVSRPEEFDSEGSRL